MLETAQVVNALTEFEQSHLGAVDAGKVQTRDFVFSSTARGLLAFHEAYYVKQRGVFKVGIV